MPQHSAATDRMLVALNKYVQTEVGNRRPEDCTTGIEDIQVNVRNACPDIDMSIEEEFQENVSIVSADGQLTSLTSDQVKALVRDGTRKARPKKRSARSSKRSRKRSKPRRAGSKRRSSKSGRRASRSRKPSKTKERSADAEGDWEEVSREMAFMTPQSSASSKNSQGKGRGSLRSSRKTSRSSEDEFQTPLSGEPPPTSDSSKKSSRKSKRRRSKAKSKTRKKKGKSTSSEKSSKSSSKKKSKPRRKTSKTKSRAKAGASATHQYKQHDDKLEWTKEHVDRDEFMTPPGNRGRFAHIKGDSKSRPQSRGADAKREGPLDSTGDLSFESAAETVEVKDSRDDAKRVTQSNAQARSTPNPRAAGRYKWGPGRANSFLSGVSGVVGVQLGAVKMNRPVERVASLDLHYSDVDASDTDQDNLNQLHVSIQLQPHHFTPLDSSPPPLRLKANNISNKQYQ